MQISIIIWIKSAKEGRNPNWITFDAFAGYFDANKSYWIEFCGTEVLTSIPLVREQKEELASVLGEEFGYGPYDLGKVNAVIGDGKQYIIKR